MPGISLSSATGTKRAKGLQWSADPVQDEPLDSHEIAEFASLPQPEDDELVLVESLITGVRELVEKRIGRLLVRRSVTAYWRRVPEGATLPLPPHGDISEVRIFAGDGTSEVLGTDRWFTRGLDEKTLFPSGGAPHGLEVDYTSGYQSLPDGIKMQMLRDIKDRFDQRDDVVVGRSVNKLPDPSAYDAWRVLS